MASEKSQEKETGKAFHGEAREGIMFSMHKELVVSLADLRFVSITCPTCRTVVTLDLKEPSEFAQKHDGAFSPKQCPGCRQDYDTAIRPSIDTFQRAYGSLIKIADRISFRGEPESAAL
jgi:hypothetical protein